MSFLIKFKSDYKDMEDFLEDVFYRKKKLAKPALKLLEKVRSNKSISSNRWKKYIIDLFKCYPLSEEHENTIEFICKKYSEHIEKSRGKKPYSVLLEKNKENKINLSEKEEVILNKAVDWNSAISSYYTIIKKLKGLGLIKKEKGEIKKSDEFLRTLKNIKSLFANKEKNSNDYVYSTK